MKLCDLCGKKVAVIHVAEVQEDGSVRSVSLCEDCARREGVIPGRGNKKGVEEIMEEAVKEQEDLPNEKRAVTCSNCGLTYEGFRTRGRLGCPNDYDVFAEMLEPLLEKIHFGTKHVGKVPKGKDEKAMRLRKLVELRKRLDEAVKREEYELAAQIRDQIRELEGGKEQGGEKSV